MKNKKKNSRKNSMTIANAVARKIVFVDIENFVGKPELSIDDVAKARKQLEGMLGIGVADHVVVGTSHSSNCLNAQLAWRGVQHVWDKGKDGADHALLETIAEYNLANYSEIFIVTGDGIFADVVDEIASRGFIVTVVHKRNNLSKKLKRVTPATIAA